MTENPLIDIFWDCRQSHVSLIPTGSDLTIDAPEGSMTDDLLDRLRRHKADLLSMLRRPGEPVRTCACGMAMVPSFEIQGWRNWDCPSCGAVFPMRVTA